MTATATTSNAENSEKLEFLISMMGNIDPKVAQRVFDKFNGDVGKAADSLLNGEAPPLDSWDSDHLQTPDYAPPPSSPATRPIRLGVTKPGAIDLTMDEDVPPHPEWALVRSNAAIDVNNNTNDIDAAQNDDIHRAIEESLAYAGSVEDINEELPPEDRIRKDDRPVVLRPQDQKFAHVGLLWQALFFVPQVRERIAGYRGPIPRFVTPPIAEVIEVDPPTDGPEGQVWSLVELFGYLELATLAELTGMPALARFELSPWSNILLANQNSDMLKELSWIIETVLTHGLAERSPEWPRLFHSRFALNDCAPDERDTRSINNDSDLSVIAVKYNDEDGSSDLLGCLSSQFFPNETRSVSGSMVPRGEVITHSSEVLAFCPIRDEVLPSYSGDNTGKKNGDRKKFRYPRSFYLDRFMQENEIVARERSHDDKEMLDQVNRLTWKKQGLTRFQNKDTLAHLRSSINYYEHVADSGTDPLRKTTIDTMALKLKTILAKIEGEVADIEKDILNLRARSVTLFDSPDLQKHRYDLRAVLMHDGLYGRKHIYSYVQQNGTWWKTLDHAVTQVSEEAVLDDRSGLHLGAGPYLLLYSRVIPESQKNTPRPWPDVVKEGARQDSEKFLNELPPEIRAKVYNPSSEAIFPLSNPFSPIDESHPAGAIDT